MRLAKFFVILAVFCCPSRVIAGADDECKEFARYADPWGVYCTNAYYIPWVVFGGGWKTTIKWANISESLVKGKVQFNTGLMPVSGPRASDGHSQNLFAILVDNRVIPLGTLQVGGGDWIPLESGNSAEVTFLYSATGCDKYGEGCSIVPIPDPEDKVSVGSASIVLFINVLNGGAEAMRGLPKPSAQFNYVGGWQATMPAYDPAPIWRTAVSLTPDRKREFMFAMGNPYKEEIVVQGKLFDQKGKVLGTQSWTLKGQTTVGLYVTGSKSDPVPGFGSDPFPQGQDFTGWLELRVISPVDGAISIVGMQSEGGTSGTMSNADVQPFYPK